MLTAARRTVERTVALEDQAVTEALAARLARLAEAGDVIALAGDLGAGKTTFARAFIRARTGALEVPSPTFTLVQIYDAADGVPVWHVDLYRIRDPAEVEELGLEEAAAGVILLIEWPDRWPAPPAGPRLRVALRPGAGPAARIATLVDQGGWARRLDRLGADD